MTLGKPCERKGDRWGLADAAEAMGGARRDLLLWVLGGTGMG